MKEKDLKEELKATRQKLFDLRLSQAYYIMEHRDTSPEIDNAIKLTRKEFAKLKMEEIEHVKH